MEEHVLAQIIGIQIAIPDIVPSIVSGQVGEAGLNAQKLVMEVQKVEQGLNQFRKRMVEHAQVHRARIQIAILEAVLEIVSGLIGEVGLNVQKLVVVARKEKQGLKLLRRKMEELLVLAQVSWM